MPQNWRHSTTIELDARTIEFLPLPAPFGAEVRGVDLTEEISDEVADAIRDAFDLYDVLVFPDQPLTPDDEIKLPSKPAAVHEIGEPQDPRFFQMALTKMPFAPCEVLFVDDSEANIAAAARAGLHAAQFVHPRSAHAVLQMRELLERFAVPVSE